VVDGVIALKFHHRLELAEFFARILIYYIKMDMKENGFEGIVPVPLHFRRYHTRGYNQTEEIGKVLSRSLDLPLWPEVLRRKRHTRPQTRLAHSERMKNVNDAFAPAFVEHIQDKHVLLLDDVYTTGSTLNVCARVLKEAGAREVTALTLCRALKTD
jgi:ComF family protein